MTNWSFADIWNKSLEAGKPDRPLAPRDHLWASELGKAPVDLYLKLKGEKPTNPPNRRAKRKFEAGNMMEWVVGSVLKRAGIFISTQEWMSHQYDELLKVTGNMDFKAGGKPNYEKAKRVLEFYDLPPFFARATEAIVEHFKEAYPSGLSEDYIEVKSCSGFMFDIYEKQGASKAHQMQLFHYLKSTNSPKGRLIYISKDDLRMLEFIVLNPSPVEDEYKNAIARITGYIRADEQPPIEPLIAFDPETCRFSKNWLVEYSDFLTKLYKFKKPSDYDAAVKGDVAKFNRTVNRLLAGKNVTANNQGVLDQIKAEYPEAYKKLESQTKKEVAK